MSLLPFQILPTEQLRPEKRLNQSSNTPKPSQQQQQQQQFDDVVIDLAVEPVKYRPLDEESGKAILNFVYSRPNFNNNNNNNKVSKPLTSKSRNTQKGVVFTYDHHHNNNNNDDVSQNKSILSMIAEKTKFITMENILKINKKFLLTNNVTIRNLIEDCKVSPVNLKLAGILTTFEDLLDLDFQLTDLTIGNRCLFNADKLVNFFKVDYRYMREHKRFSFSVAEMKEVNFYPSELSTMEFHFSDLVDEKMINRQDLRELNFTCEGFKLLGLTRSHTRELNISRNFALTKLKWTVEECDEFDLDDVKCRNKKQIK
jgi:hypothetical protein